MPFLGGEPLCSSPDKIQNYHWYVNIIFDAWSITDYAHRWGMKPFFYFMKGFVNKYIYHFPLEGGFVEELKSDTDHLNEQLKSLFSLYKYQVK